MAKKTDNSALQELKSQIKEKNPQRLYIFHGEEIFLLHHYLQQLQKIILEDVADSFNFTRLSSETYDIQTFADAEESYPMMADRTLIHVDEVDLFKLPEWERNKIAEVLSDIPDWCTVVFTYETVAWKPDKRLKKFWETLEREACIVEFCKQDQRDLISWIQRHFVARGKRISPELAAYLIDITGGTMTALAGEIAKIAAYSGSDTICRADIDAVTEPVLDAVVFQMTDLMSQGRFSQALQKLQELLKMQQEPILILGAIGGNFRRIAVARTLIDHALPYGELMKLCGMADYAARKTMDAARKFRPEFCAKAAQLILETDYKMKTSFDDPQRLLEMLVLQLAQEGSR